MSTPVELRHAVSDAEIAACFPVMRELRTHLVDAAEMVDRVRRQHADRYRLLAAWRGREAVGLAGYRLTENLIHGRFVYVDDLVVREDERRGGLGAQLLDAVKEEARRLGCAKLVLDTAIGNALGQRFYFRYGMLPTALRFACPVPPRA